MSFTVSIFKDSFASIENIFILEGKIGAMLYFYELLKIS